MLGSNPQNIRYDGTGRMYAQQAGTSGMLWIGELETLTFNNTVTKETLKSNQWASKATILEVEKDREAVLSWGMREMSEENLKMALMGSAINQDNQALGHVYQASPSLADDLFIDLGHLNTFITRIAGAITGSLTVGSTVTGANSAATGQIAHVGANFILLVDVSGVFQSGEAVEQTPSTIYITATSVEKLEDVCVTDATGATLRAQGTDYSLDPDYGYFRKLSAGGMAAGDVLSYDYEAVDRNYIHGLSGGVWQGKIVAVADKDDKGPRQRWTFHQVNISLNGELPLIGEGVQLLGVSGSVIADTTQPSGQEYYKLEMM